MIGARLFGRFGVAERSLEFVHVAAQANDGGLQVGEGVAPVFRPEACEAHIDVIDGLIQVGHGIPDGLVVQQRGITGWLISAGPATSEKSGNRERCESELAAIHAACSQVLREMCNNGEEGSERGLGSAERKDDSSGGDEQTTDELTGGECFSQQRPGKQNDKHDA